MLPTKSTLLQWTEVLKKTIKTDSRYAIWRLASILVVGLLGVSVISTIYFIYNNIYTTLSNSNAILILNSGIDNDAIDLKSYEQAKKIINIKSQLPEIPANIRNIFFYDSQQK